MRLRVGVDVLKDEDIAALYSHAAGRPRAFCPRGCGDFAIGRDFDDAPATGGSGIHRSARVNGEAAQRRGIPDVGRRFITIANVYRIGQSRDLSFERDFQYGPRITHVERIIRTESQTFDAAELLRCLPQSRIEQRLFAIGCQPGGQDRYICPP